MSYTQHFFLSVYLQSVPNKTIKTITWTLERVCYLAQTYASKAFCHTSTCLQRKNIAVVKILDCGCEMNGRCMQTGVSTDHCNYEALGESSFLCRFICHINKGISGSTNRGWGWQCWKFEKINELWQCCTWGEEVCARSSGYISADTGFWLQHKKKKRKRKAERGLWL